MTKKIRIENADTSNHKVLVKVQQKNAEGNWVDAANLPVNLDMPTLMTEQYIHSTQRIVIEEV